jgi:hypothetical protein
MLEMVSLAHVASVLSMRPTLALSAERGGGKKKVVGEERQANGGCPSRLVAAAVSAPDAALSMRRRVAARALRLSVCEVMLSAMAPTSSRPPRVNPSALWLRSARSSKELARSPGEPDVILTVGEDASCGDAECWVAAACQMPPFPPLLIATGRVGERPCPPPCGRSNVRVGPPAATSADQAAYSARDGTAAVASPPPPPPPLAMAAQCGSTAEPNIPTVDGHRRERAG